MKRSLVFVCLLVLSGCSLDVAGTQFGPEAGPTPGAPADAGAPDRPPVPPPAPTPPDAPDAALPSPSPDAAGPPPPDAPPSPPDPGPPDPAASAPCPQDPELAFCLRFEGQIIDESPSRLPIEGAPLRFAPGPTGLAAELAPGAHLSIAETPVLDSATITLQASVRPSTLGRYMTVVENPGQYGVVISSSGSVFCGAGSSGLASAGNAVRPGVWTRLHCVLDGQSIRLWIDGELAAESSTPGLVTSRPYGLRIGWDDAPPRPYSGLIDDVRVWTSARLPAAD